MNWFQAMWRRMRCKHASVKGIHGDERLYGVSLAVPRVRPPNEQTYRPGPRIRVTNST